MIRRSVIFDVGRVLFDWDLRYLFAKLIAEKDELDWFVTNIVTPEWHFQHDAGRPFAETSAELAAAHPEHHDLIQQFGPRFGETIPGPIPGMVDLVEELDRTGVPLFAITNFSAEFWEPFRIREAALFDRFRDIVVSGAEQLVKPDPAIFALALKRFGLNPGEALFVDDRAENIAAGKAAGLIGHVFRDTETLRTELVERQLL